MRRVSLAAHPASPSAAIRAVEVELPPIEAGRLTLRYVLRGDIAAVRVPERRDSRRADELWRHTCCELFIAAGAGEGYSEYNFSPSGEWAAYGFESYRAGMRPLDAAPLIHVRREAQVLLLEAAISVNEDVMQGRAPLALTAVIEETDGRVSYWALKHSAGKPDFHHRAGFAFSFSG